ncbi:MAG: PEGA domain-containing protein, partial [Polyangiaceae bacterium]
VIWITHPVTLAIGAALLGLALVFGIAAAFGRGRGTPHAAVQASTVSAATGGIIAPRGALTAAADADDTNEVPLISVDSLPVATRGATPTKGNGRLSIGASPGSCSVSVDGVARGATPLTGVELSAGVHRIECAVAGGKSKTANVSVAEGGTTHFRFALDEGTSSP